MVTAADREGEIGARRAVETVFRADRARILSVLIRDLGDFDLAEEGLQEAFAEALRTWPHDGEPRNPAGWIVATARNRAIDRLRRHARGQVKLEAVGRELDLAAVDAIATAVASSDEVGDERLRLIFTCCHPALALETRVALTLRTIAGLRTDEIARAFLVKESTMQQRLVRAKRKIRDAAIPYRVPEDAELVSRLGGVLAVIYLVFNEGYSPTVRPEPLRRDMCTEAIGLGTMLADLMPDEAEVMGLCALMLLHHSRAAARVDGAGDLVSLGEQDRALWDRHAIDRGDALLRRALRMGAAGPYQLQAAISAVHCMAPDAAATDWNEISDLYARLLSIEPSPTIAIGRAIAVGMARGAEAGLDVLPPAEPPLDRFHRWHAAHADLLWRAGRQTEARSAYARAADLATSPAEKRWFSRRAER